MDAFFDALRTKIYGDFVAESHSVSQGGRSTPISYDEMSVDPLCDSTEPDTPQWLSLQLEGFAGDLRTHYKTSFSMPLDVLERVLQIFLDGVHGPDDQKTIGQMIWRLAHHATDQIESDASEQTG